MRTRSTSGRPIPTRRRCSHPSRCPIRRASNERKRIILRGEVGEPVSGEQGCRFRARCPFAMEVCADVEPEPYTHASRDHGPLSSPHDGSGAGGGHRPVARRVSRRTMSDAFHPDLARVARWLPRSAVSPRTLRPARMGTGLLARIPKRGVAVQRLGPTSVRVHQPAASHRPRPALLWIHGGGYVLGTAAQDDALCSHFAQSLGIVVAAVEYRLAPEHPFPVPLHDCYEALTWLARQPQVDPARVAVGGASAGGGLAAALALLAHERGEVQLAFQLLAYPMLDDRTAARAGITDTNFRLWNNTANRFGWQSYTGLPPGSHEVTGLAAPSRYGDLSGLPPAWIGVGTLDLFHDEDRAYERRLREAGVDCGSTSSRVRSTVSTASSPRPASRRRSAFRRCRRSPRR